MKSITITVGSTTVTVATPHDATCREAEPAWQHDEAHRAACDALNISREGAPGLPGLVGQLARQRDEARREREVCALRLRDAASEAETLRTEVERLRTNMAAEVERLTRERDEARAATRAARDESDNWRAASVDMRALIGCEPGERVDDAARRVIRERDCEMADNDNLIAQRAELQLEVDRLTTNLTATEAALKSARADNNTTPLRCALHAALGMGPGEPATQDALVRRAAHLLERAQGAQAETRT